MLNSNNILIIGSGGHAKVVIDIIENNNEYKIIGIIDSFNKSKDFLGYKILGGTEKLEELLNKYNINSGIVTIGDNLIRKKEIDNILKINPDFNFISVIHKNSIISKNVKLGKGVFIGAGVIINTFSNIGDFSLINTKVSIDHDCELGIFSSVGPGVTLGGGIKIGDFTHIGLGANILEKINIGNHCLIGASSLVNKNIENYSIVYGVPGKFIKTRVEGERIYK